MFIRCLNKCLQIAGILVDLKGRKIETGSHWATWHHQILHLSQFGIVTSTPRPAHRLLFLQGGFTSTIRALCSSVLICRAHNHTDFIVHDEFSMHEHHLVQLSLLYARWLDIFMIHVVWTCQGQSMGEQVRLGEDRPVTFFLFFLRENNIHVAWN